MNDDLNKNLNEISKNLIDMHVSNLLSKHNISKANNNLKNLSNDQRNQLAESIRNLQKQTETFLQDTSNKNGDVQLTPDPQTLVQQLQNLQNKNK